MLAIVIPFYKAIFFEETLKSLKNQTDHRFHVYIGNDDSPDNIEELINRYSRSLDISYQIFDKNLGGTSLVSQWKRCLEMLKDESWFIILGDDDLLSKDYVEQFYKNLPDIEENQVKVVRYATVLISDSGEKISEAYMHPTLENSIDSLVRKVQGKTRSSLSEYVFKRSKDLDKVFLEFPNAYYADDLSILLNTDFGNIFTINHTFFFFRRGNFNLSGTNSDSMKSQKAKFMFFKHLLDDYPDKFTNCQKSLFLFRLTRLFLQTKSVKVLFYVLKEQIKIGDVSGLFYLPKLALHKMSGGRS